MDKEEEKINTEDTNTEEQALNDMEAVEEKVDAENKEEEIVKEVETHQQDPLEEIKEENEKLKDHLLRQMAEFDNYKKRTLKEKAELILSGGEKTIAAILPILDDFERALADKCEDSKVIKEGMENIFHKFIKTLETLGVKKIETEGKEFDVDYHEAIAMVPGVEEDKKGKVIDCIQAGYTMNEKVIRHAKVAVGQ